MEKLMIPLLFIIAFVALMYALFGKSEGYDDVKVYSKLFGGYNFGFPTWYDIHKPWAFKWYDPAPWENCYPINKHEDCLKQFRKVNTGDKKFECCPQRYPQGWSWWRPMSYGRPYWNYAYL